MFLNLKDLTVDELYEKTNDLYRKLMFIEQSGSHAGTAHQQCMTWIQQIEMEIQERLIMESENLETGTVAIIGEDERKEEDDDGDVSQIFNF